MKILIKNIRSLCQVEYEESSLKTAEGKRIKEVPQINNAWLALEDGKIADFGSMQELAGVTDWNQLEVIDAEGKLVLPAWIDSHTHIVYAKSREQEFVDRINGLSYESIAANGGGILNSADKLRLASEDELFESALHRIDEMIGFGTAAIEIKSGYGLSLESEIKMLRVIKKLKSATEVIIKSNLLAAHAIPREYKDNRSAYIDIIVNEIIPTAVDENLADYIDVFCDRGFYTIAETDRILDAASKYGLKPKIHANELDFSGGIQVGVKHGAISVDHLECVGDEEIEVLLKSNTIPTLLPSTAFFLNLHYPPARKMIDAGLPIALATDYNPGSSPSGNMPFVLSLACSQMKMTPEEAINAATINAAKAMEIEKEVGTIKVGKKANLIITKEMPSLAYIPYAFGKFHIDKMIINGKIKN